MITFLSVVFAMLFIFGGIAIAATLAFVVAENVFGIASEKKLTEDEIEEQASATFERDVTPAEIQATVEGEWRVVGWIIAAGTLIVGLIWWGACSVT